MFFAILKFLISHDSVLYQQYWYAERGNLWVGKILYSDSIIN
jgi:hypothetical protein